MVSRQATMGTLADWPTLPDLANEEWNNDFDTLFGLDGVGLSHYDDLLASDPSFNASVNFLGHLQEPDQMNWEQDVMGAWGVPSQTMSPSVEHRHAAESFKHFKNSFGMLSFGNMDNIGSDATKGGKKNTKSPSSTKGTSRKKQPRISQAARQILLDHFAHSPYPTNTEVNVLSGRTQLEPKRVRTWFNNHRCRQPTQDNDASSTCAVVGRDQKEIHRLSKDSLEQLEPFQADYQLEAWKTSPMQNEAAATFAIEAAVAERNSLQIHDRPSYTSSTSIVSRAPSVHSSWGGASSAGSAATRNTKYSSSSVGSNLSTMSRARRRGRRRIPKNDPYPSSQDRKTQKKPIPPVLPEEDRRARPYFCTFPPCTSRFTAQYDWSRHEQIHVPQTIWVCCCVQDAFFHKCPFCGIASPDADHLEGSHGYQACASRPEEDRTFYRRDQFVQHLHTAHFAKRKHPDPDSGCSRNSEFGCHSLAQRWKRPAPRLEKGDPALHCGFCGDLFETWEERRRHVAAHFNKENRDLSSWWPGRLPGMLENTFTGIRGDPVCCRYCRQDFWGGSNVHPTCKIWSCRFLRHIDDLAIRDGLNVVPKPFFITASHRATHRDCPQEFFQSYKSFAEHLHDWHGGQDAWQNDDYYNLERNYCQVKRAVFMPSMTEATSGSSTLFDVIPGLGAPASQHIDLINRPLPALPVVSRDSIPPQFRFPSVSAPAPDGAQPRLSDDKGSSRWRSLADVKRFSRRSEEIKDTGPSSMQGDENTKSSPPRFYIGFRSLFSEMPSLFYLRREIASLSPEDGPPKKGVHLAEIEKGTVACLAFSAALTSIGVEGIQCRMQKDVDTGWVELGTDEQDLAWAGR